MRHGGQAGQGEQGDQKAAWHGGTFHVDKADGSRRMPEKLYGSVPLGMTIYEFIILLDVKSSVN